VRRVRVGLLAAALGVASCGAREAAAPREALESLRSALLAGDGGAFVKLLDSESRSRALAEVRERRALVARGDDPAKVLAGLPMTADELARGDEAETIALFFPRRSPYFKDASWIAEAAVADGPPEDPDTASLVLRGKNGVVHAFWFVRESGAWKFDNLRTRREWQ